MERWIMLVFVIALIGWRSLAVTIPVTSISSDQLQTMMESASDFVLIDVREPIEYQKGTIPGAILIPLQEIATTEQLANLAKDKKIVVMCHSGARSARAQRQLLDMGYTSVINLDGGIIAWKGPIVTQ